MRDSVSTRLRVLSILIVIIAVSLIGRLFILQVLQGSQFEDEASRQYLSSKSGPFRRGDIFFLEKGGRLVTAATVRPYYYVSINPKLMESVPQAYKILSEIIFLDKEKFEGDASNKDDTYSVIAKDIPEDAAVKISASGLKGVYLHKDGKRYYPGGELASNVVGFVGKTLETGDGVSGRNGVERYYESVLKRESRSIYANFFAELFSDFGKTMFDTTAKREGDIVLTIEPSVQKEVERVMIGIAKKYAVEEAGAIIILPKTGEISAMASFPTFNPEKYGEADANTYSNPNVQSAYEMGSIVKPLTMAAGLDAGVVKSDTIYEDLGKIKVADAVISNFDKKGRGKVPMQQVLSQSLNTGAVFVQQKLGAVRFQRYMHGFGFGEYTNVDLPGETVGMVKNIDSRRPVELATASFGQGFAVTPLSMARALSALANGGKIVRPHVVNKIVHPMVGDEIIENRVERQVLDPASAESITRMLVEVVDVALLHGKAKMEHYTVAAKTGTAQIANPAGGGYYKDRYLHSFFGYAPAYNSRFLIFMYIKNPKGVTYASETLTEPFLELAKFMIHYYDIPPDR